MSSSKVSSIRRQLSKARRDQNFTMTRYLEGQLKTFQEELHSKDRRRKTRYEEQSKGW